jgi:hypothetical protein
MTAEAVAKVRWDHRSAAREPQSHPGDRNTEKLVQKRVSNRIEVSRFVQTIYDQIEEADALAPCR